MIAESLNGRAHAPPAAADPDVRTVPLADVRPWPGNPRKTFTGVEDLAANLARMGQLVPLLVRPHPTGRGYEIADGERRYRAAGPAGLGHLRVEVRQLTDKEMLEIAVASCEQREDVPPLEKAAGYAALVKEHGVKVEDLAATLGKSTATVRAYLQLTDLPPLATEALRGGGLSRETAVLIGRVPGQAQRELLTRMVLCNHTWEGLSEAQAREAVKNGVEPMSSRRTRQLVESRFMVPLGGCAFSQSDATLPGGSCKACPKRAGNLKAADPDGYAGVRADVCTDPACFRAKAEAHQQRLVDAAKGSGCKVLEGAAAKKVFPNRGYMAGDAPYYDLDERCGRDDKGRTYGELLKGRLKDLDVELCPDPDGRIHRLAHKDLAVPILKDLGVLTGSASFNGPAARTSEEDKKERAKRLLENKVRRLTVLEVQGRAAAQAERLFAALPADDPRLNQVLRVLAGDLLDAAYPSVVEDVCKRRGLDGKRTFEQKQQLDDVIAAAGAPQLVALMAELSSGRHVFGHGAGPESKALQAALGLDPRKAEAEVKARLKGEREAKKAGKGKAPKGPAAAPERPPLTQATPLAELLPWPAAAATEPLRRAGMTTVGDLLRVARDCEDPSLKGSEPMQRVFEVLKRHVPGLTREHALAIGDALVDAGGPAKIPPGEPVSAPTPPPAAKPDKPRPYETYEVKWLREQCKKGNKEAKRELKLRGVPEVGKPGRPRKEVPSS